MPPYEPDLSGKKLLMALVPKVILFMKIELNKIFCRSYYFWLHEQTLKGHTKANMHTGFVATSCNQ
jgi:hypothetical protein